ncbi:hypothetical protein [Roseomonas marmotae]|uniref:Uncharacterized protein n=1 Tax=Roseomonas marmotae TaxID=2768161 RepID=A0ABS3K9U3_9PROT|nr:hypothetical protein [Roseomonas marmotae]MBO1074224.1 hypothetical protein [Roseomonas marmotae]QTI78989.1 hypothetical protein IAI58_15325 [Roseomonas marmotae]
MPERPDDAMKSQDRQKPGNHPAARPGQEPDPHVAQPARRPGEPELQGGPADAGSAGTTGTSRA